MSLRARWFDRSEDPAGDHIAFEPRSALSRRPPLMAGEQTGQTLLGKAGLPAGDIGRTTAQGMLGGGP